MNYGDLKIIYVFLSIRKNILFGTKLIRMYIIFYKNEIVHPVFKSNYIAQFRSLIDIKNEI